MLVIVSDFHLGEGWSESTGKLARTEDFYFDQAFARFLDHLEEEKKRQLARDGFSPEVEPSIHLIINGDLFDFLQVGVTPDELAKLSDDTTTGKRRPDAGRTDVHASAARLDKVYKGHKKFFQALARFVDNGNNLTVISGNHDIELYWPEIKDRFKDKLAEALVADVPEQAMADGGQIVADAQLRSNVHFSDWFYYDRDYKLYVEHGHQYESWNSFHYPLWPVLPGKQTALYLPPGSFFVRHFLNRVEALDPFADNIKPNIKYLQWAMRNNVFRMAKLLRILRQFIFTLALYVVRRRFRRISHYSHADRQLFNAETDRRLEKIGAGSPSPVSKPVLKQLLATHRKPSAHASFAAGIASVLAIGAVLLGALFVVQLAWYGAKSFTYLPLAFSVLVFAAGMIVERVGERMSDDTLEAARGIAAILNGNGHPVKYVVFGHTHDPDVAPIGRAADGRDVLYFNTGTWTIIFNEADQILGHEKQFGVFMFERRDEKPRLLRWNDDARDIEPLPLFERVGDERA